MRRARWEIVRTAAGYGRRQVFHARLRSSNGAVIVWSKTYTRRAAAVRAVELATGWPVLRSRWGAVVKHGGSEIPVRDVDERGDADDNHHVILSHAARTLARPRLYRGLRTHRDSPVTGGDA